MNHFSSPLSFIHGKHFRLEQLLIKLGPYPGVCIEILTYFKQTASPVYLFPTHMWCFVQLITSSYVTQ